MAITGLRLNSHFVVFDIIENNKFLFTALFRVQSDLSFEQMQQEGVLRNDDASDRRSENSELDSLCLSVSQANISSPRPKSL